MDSPPVPQLQRQDSNSREAFLIEYATQHSRDKEEIPLDEGWEICQTYGIDILSRNLVQGMRDRRPFGNKGYSSLYTISFNMCAQANTPDHSEAIYNRINDAMQSFLENTVVAPLLDPQLVGISMITKFSRAWENHKIMIKWVQMLFRHLDRGYITNNTLPTLTSCGMQKFLDVAFAGTAERVVHGVLEVVDREREGDLVDRDALKNCVEVFIVMGLAQHSQTMPTVKELLVMEQNLDVYETHFEKQYLDKLREYYESRAVAWRENDSVSEYLKRCEKALTDERDRVMQILHPSTEPKVRASLEHVLLSVPQAELINRPNSGLYYLLVEDRKEDLQRMYQLFTREGVQEREKPMTVVFQQFVTDQGMAVLEEKRSDIQRLVAEGKKETATDIKMILHLLTLFRKTESTVVDLFANNIGFQKGMKNAFTTFVNTNASDKFSNVELLVAYCDGVLKGKEGSEKLDDPAMEERLDGSMKIFTHLTEKDLFAELYRDALAKRLLSDKSSSMEMEKAMITKLKQSQGPPFTSKIEGMIKDFQMIAEAVSDFGSFVKKGAKLPCEPEVQVLTQGFWPSQPKITIQLPSTLATVVKRYEEYYDSKHSGKKRLHWIHSLGNAAVQGVFPKGTYTLMVTTLQAAALVQCAETPNITTIEFADHLHTDMEVVKRILHSLSCGKFKVLKKKGPGEKTKISDEDRFTPNAEFTSKVKKFSIQMASLDNVKQIKERVKEDRSFAIDAALVRIMKARKKLNHQDLIAEVISQLNQFKPEISQVKKRIESLIEREYLARREDAMGNWTKEYDYLA